MAFDWKPFSDKAMYSMKYSRAKINIWEGSVRSGKTISSIVRWVQFCRKSPKNHNLLMCGRTMTTLKRNILDVIIDMVGTNNARFKFGSQEFELFGRTIWVVGANDETAQEKIRGMTLGGAYCDELSLYPESFFKMLSTRMSVEGAMIFASTNPDSPMHWLKTDYIDKATATSLHVRTFHFTLDDNLALPKDYVKTLKAEFSGLFYQRFIEGKWVQAEGSVFSMWDEKIHTDNIDKLLQNGNRKKFKHYAVGVDYGTSNPTVFLMIGYDSFSGKKHVVKEYYYKPAMGKQKTDSQFAKDLAEFCRGYNPRYLVIDPSALSFKTELRANRIFTTDAKNSKIDGIRFVSSLLNKEELVVDDRKAPWVIREFSSYLWNSKKTAIGIDEPIKDHDHTMDALRYVLYTLFGSGKTGILGGINKR